MLKLTQEMFGGNDEEFQRGGDVEGHARGADGLFNFSARTASRREHPTEDSSAIANATINGEPLSRWTLSYYVIVASPGHDDHQRIIAGGMRALLEHPDQLASAAERHVADADRGGGDDPLVVPVKEFMRTAQGTPRCGVKIAKAAVYLAYLGQPATRDVFTDPRSSTSAATRTSTSG